MLVDATENSEPYHRMWTLSFRSLGLEGMKRYMSGDWGVAIDQI